MHKSFKPGDMVKLATAATMDSPNILAVVIEAWSGEVDIRLRTALIPRIQCIVVWRFSDHLLDPGRLVVLPVDLLHVIQ